MGTPWSKMTDIQKEKARERTRKHKADDKFKEKRRICDSIYRENNKVKLQSYQRLWNKKNKDKIKSRRAEHYKNNKHEHFLMMKKWRMKNKLYLRLYAKTYREKLLESLMMTSVAALNHSHGHVIVK